MERRVETEIWKEVHRQEREKGGRGEVATREDGKQGAARRGRERGMTLLEVLRLRGSLAGRGAAKDERYPRLA